MASNTTDNDNDRDKYFDLNLEKLIHNFDFKLNSSDMYTDLKGNNKKDSIFEPYTFGSVINISSKELSECQLSLLNKGLNFCPTPGENDLSLLKQDLDQFHVSLKRKAYFQKGNISNSQNSDNSVNNFSDDQGVINHNNIPFHDPKFKEPSTWVPGAPQIWRL